MLKIWSLKLMLFVVMDILRLSFLEISVKVIVGF